MSEQPTQEQMQQRDHRARNLAHYLVTQHEPFHAKPQRLHDGILVLGYRRRLEIDGINLHEAGQLLQADIDRVFRALYPRLFPLMRLTAGRLAVMLHLGLIFGVEPLKAQTKLWDALRREDYEAAAAEMLLSEWPALIGRREGDARRAIDMYHIMLTGHPRTPAPTTKPS